MSSVFFSFLLQNLVGFEQVVDGAPTGIIEIVAGGRRLGAIGTNIASGLFSDDFLIPYLLVSIEEAVTISLAESMGREPMHHADVFDAMMELSLRGVSVDDIALAFGVDPLIVRRRLKLAKVAPRFVAMYRDDQINLEQMAALAISDDHARLIKKVFYRYSSGEKLVHTSIEQPALPVEVEASSAWAVVAAKRELLKASLPQGGGGEGLMAWLLMQPQAVILDFLAFCTGCSIDAMQQREGPLPAFAEVGQAVALDMRAWWEPTSGNYLSHLSRARILEVVTQAVSPAAAQPLVSMKKDVLVDAAERALKGSGWVPTILATSST